MEQTSSEDLETIREFLVESHENLSRLDQDLVELEKHPRDTALLGSIFRTIHTIKGACGFLSFSVLEGITHQAESLLSQLRDGTRELTPELVSLILETVDATRKVMAQIESTGKEGDARFDDLTERLRAAAQMKAPIAETTPASKPEVTETAKAEVTHEAAQEKAEAHDEVNTAEYRGPERRRRDDDGGRAPGVVDANIRVGVGLLDKLMDLVGELVLTRNQILQFNVEREDAALNATSQRLNLITTELQEGVMKTRMQPIGVVWNKLPRVVRDMAVALNKQIQLVMDGADTELDRTIIEAIKDPLMHLVRNSCDHGIELPEKRVRAGKAAQGILTLRAYHEGGQVNIEVGDDGAGIDVARVKQKAVENGLLRQEQADKLSDREAYGLIFQPGFSTAQTVTNISGRGVGMDVVKSHIEKIGGVVDLSSRAGEGSTIKIRIPLTLAIIPGLVITSGGERFVIPQVSLLELIRLEGETSGKHIEYVHGTPVYRRRGSLLPIAYLNEVLGLQSTDASEAVNMVVLQAEDRVFGLVVDGINDTQEIVVKPLGKQLKGLTLYAGATIMGDGRVALILDVLGIGQRSGVLAEVHEGARNAGQTKPLAEVEQQRVLLFKAGPFERLAVPLSLVARLEEFPRSEVERAGGGEVVQYRERILPLVSLRTVLDPGCDATSDSSDPVQVVVFQDGESSVGMVVDQIVDITEEAVTVRQKSGRRGLLGSAVVGKRVTDFVDLSEVFHAVQGGWAQGAVEGMPEKRLLIIEASSFARAMIRNGLDMAGYAVLEAESSDEALGTLEREPLDCVLMSVDLPGGVSSLLQAMRARPSWEVIPVIGLTASAEPEQRTAARQAGFDDCQAKFDQASLVPAVARLLAVGAPLPTGA